MENAVDKNFDKLEIWTLRNVFALGRGKGEDEGLGDWVRLGHYEVCISFFIHHQGVGKSNIQKKITRTSNPPPKTPA